MELNVVCPLFPHYDAFGTALNLALPGTGNEQLFTGRQLDVDIGLYYYRARYYDPEIGRFISEDPLGFGAGVNFYAYVNNNPVNFNDPSGEVCLPCGAIGTGVGALIGLGVESAKQIFTGDINASKLIGSTIGGAVTGGTIGLTGGASLLAVGGAAGLGGATGNLAKQGAGNLLGEQEGFNTVDFVTNTTFSAIAGSVGSKIKIPFPGVTTGRNSFSTITKSTFTKLNSGSIQNVSATTIGKAVVAETISDLPGQTVQSGLDFIFDTVNDSSFLNFNENSAGGGFVLYPSKPNTNMLQSVYSK